MGLNREKERRAKYGNNEGTFTTWPALLFICPFYSLLFCSWVEVFTSSLQNTIYCKRSWNHILLSNKVPYELALSVPFTAQFPPSSPFSHITIIPFQWLSHSHFDWLSSTEFIYSNPSVWRWFLRFLVLPYEIPLNVATQRCCCLRYIEFIDTVAATTIHNPASFATGFTKGTNRIGNTFVSCSVASVSAQCLYSSSVGHFLPLRRFLFYTVWSLATPLPSVQRR